MKQVSFTDLTNVELKKFTKETRSFAELFDLVPQYYHNVVLSKEMFPAVVVNALRRQNCRTLCDLLTYSPEQLLSIRDIGIIRFLYTVNTMWTYCQNNEGDKYFIKNSQKYLINELETIKIILSNNIKNFRKRKGQTQYEFAAGCDISLKILQEIEDCTADPYLTILKKISIYMGLCVSDLLWPQQFNS